MRYFKRIIFLLFFINETLFSFTGEVTHLSVPLYEKATRDSEILEHKRRGDQLPIHEKTTYLHEINDFVRRKKTDVYQVMLTEKMMDLPHEEFYETLTALGQKSFVEKKYVKIIYGDERENREEEKIENVYDETDYRLEEPLYESYPVIPQENIRLLTSFGWIQDKTNDFDTEVSALYLNRWGKENRRLFGGIGFSMSYGNGVQERFSYAVGPYLQTDLFVFSTGRFSFTAGLAFYFWEKINQHEGNGVVRSYRGSHLSARGMLHFISEKINNSFYFSSSLAAETPLYPYELKNEAAGTIFKKGIGVKGAFFLGILLNY